jgi:hypothetical protein
MLEPIAFGVHAELDERFFALERCREVNQNGRIQA